LSFIDSTVTIRAKAAGLNRAAPIDNRASSGRTGMHRQMLWGLLGLAIYSYGVSSPAAANDVADFYKGKQLTMLIGTSTGGDVDARARMVARYMGKHIPGQPSILPRNMPGAVGVVAANWLYNVAPKDGTVIHAVMQGMPAFQAMGGQGVEFDAAKLQWLGNTVEGTNVVVMWHASKIGSIADARTRQVVMGAPGTANNCVFYPLLLNALVGTHFKVITGYPGGNDVNLAMERGEVEGRGCGTWTGWLSTKPDWVEGKKIVVLAQGALKRSADLPTVPTLIELVESDFEKSVMRFMSSDGAYSRAYATNPGLPAARLMALRRAFDATMQDAEFLSEAKKTDRELSPSTGEEVQKVVEALIATPKDVLAHAKTILDQGAKLDEGKGK
jgi:tripartite-type tricarboxylate transporter receptor subunit TctC